MTRSPRTTRTTAAGDGWERSVARRRWWWLPAVAVLVAVLAAASAALVRQPPRDTLPVRPGASQPPRPVSERAVRDPSAVPALGRWRAMAAAPLQPRVEFVSAWTGRELLVWGGRGFDRFGVYETYANGAAYDPELDRWRRLASGPLRPRHSAAAVWTGRELLVWGGVGRGSSVPLPTLGDGAAYDPDRDRWRRLPAAPVPPRQGAAAAWTGREMLVWGGFEPGTGSEHVDGGAYDPARDRWRVIADWPFTPNRDVTAPRSAVVGRQVLVLDPAYDGSDMALYVPATDRWRPLPPPAVDGFLDVALVTAGDAAVAVGAFFGPSVGEVALRYDLAAETWTPLPAPPVRGVENSGATWSGDAVVAWVGQRRDSGMALDLAGRRWRRLAPAPLLPRAGHAQVWAGDRLLVWGGAVRGRAVADGAAWSP